MAAGNIVIDLLLKTGSFETDTKRAEKSLKSLERSAKDFATAFRASFAGNFVAGAVTELVAQLGRVPGLFNELVAGAGKFQDVAERIGDAAEDVAGFAVALSVTNTEVDQLADFSVKLSKALAGTDEESDKAAKALSRIGIQFEQFKKLNPVAQVDELARALDQFASGPQQAVILESLVKGGSQLLPFLKELQASGGRQNILTAEQIRLADEYTDRQARSAAVLKAYAQIVATDALPALTALQNAFGELIKGMIATEQGASGLTRDNAVAQWAKGAALFVAEFVDSLRKAGADIAVFTATTKREFADLVLLDARAKDILTRASSLNFKNASPEVASALEARNKAVGDVNKALADRLALDNTKFQNLVTTQFDILARSGQRNAATDPRSTVFQGNKPKIDDSGLGTDAGSKDDPRKQLLENQLKALEAVIKREQNLLSDRNRFLDLYNSQGLLSISSYYEAQQAIIDAATTSQIAAYDKQLDALKAAQAAATKNTDRASIQGKIDDTIEKRAEVERKAGAQSLELGFKRQAQEKAYRAEVEAASAAVLELQGNLALAAGIRFDQQNANLIARAYVEGDEALKSMLASLRAATVAQAKFTQGTKGLQDVFDDLYIVEQRIAIARATGATGEIEQLLKVGQARKEAVELARAELRILEAIPNKNSEQLKQIERLRLEIDQLAVTVDPLADKFRLIFTDSFGNALGDFISGTKSAKEAFNDFANSVVQSISRMVAQNLAEKLFGGGGAAGGGGGGIDVGAIFGSIFGGVFGGARAGGGDVFPGREYLVGENGPERFRPRTAGTIIPTQEAGAGRTTVININQSFQGTPDRRTTNQAAADAARQLQSSQRDL